jgi:hypothetical protein
VALTQEPASSHTGPWARMQNGQLPGAGQQDRIAKRVQYVKGRGLMPALFFRHNGGIRLNACVIVQLPPIKNEAQSWRAFLAKF